MIVLDMGVEDGWPVVVVMILVSSVFIAATSGMPSTVHGDLHASDESFAIIELGE